MHDLLGLCAVGLGHKSAVFGELIFPEDVPPTYKAWTVEAVATVPRRINQWKLS